MEIMKTLTLSANINTMKKIILKPAPNIAPRGEQSGVFHDITQSIVTDANEAQTANNLSLVVQLDATDPMGKNYQVQKKYNLLGRGFASFSKDFESWKGRPLTEDEIEGFDADVLLKGKKVVCIIKHRIDGKDTVPMVKAFLPPNQTT